MRNMNIFLKTLLIIGLSLHFSGCCNCTDEAVSFSPEQKSWFIKGNIGDSVVFENTSGKTKTYRVKRNGFYELAVRNPRLRNCNCPEDQNIYYEYLMEGEDLILGPANSGHEAMQLRIHNYNHPDIHPSNLWFNIDYGLVTFRRFDQVFDSLLVNNRMYKEVYMHLNLEPNPKYRIIYFSKTEGFIRFENDSTSWARVN
jgi:hypothetical protein